MLLSSENDKKMSCLDGLIFNMISKRMKARKSAYTVSPQKVTLGPVKARVLLCLSGLTSMVWSKCENVVFISLCTAFT